MSNTIRAVRRYGHLEVSTCITRSPLGPGWYGMAPQASSPWQRDDDKPEVGNGLHHLSELEKIDWLGDVAVRMRIVGFRHVPGILRGGQHHHRNVFECRISFNLFQDLLPTFFGEVQIEQDKVRTRGMGIRPFAMQKC